MNNEQQTKADPTIALTRQLLEWIAAKPRTYAEVLEAWRTTCPRLAIWEDACADGLIQYDPGTDRIVSVSPKGQALLRYGLPDVDSGQSSPRSRPPCEPLTPDEEAELVRERDEAQKLFDKLLELERKAKITPLAKPR